MPNFNSEPYPLRWMMVALAVAAALVVTVILLLVLPS